MPLLGLLRGTGSTLTSYVFDNAPTGDLNQPQKAYAAAFVLLMIVLALNVLVDVFGRRAGACDGAEQRHRRCAGSSRSTTTPRPAAARRCRSATRHGTATATDATRLRCRAAAAPARHVDGDRAHAGAAPVDRLRPKPAVRSVSLPVRQGEVLALIGPSGCGKTTLLRSLNRLTELTKGRLAARPYHARRRRHHQLEPTLLRRRVTMVFQQPNPFPMSVFDNVAYVLREQGQAHRASACCAQPVRGRAGPRRSARGGQGQPRPPGAAPVRRPAAAPLHRPGAGREPRGAAAGRALLGARPSVRRR